MPIDRKIRNELLGILLDEKNEFDEEPHNIKYDLDVMATLLRLINLEPSFRIFTCQLVGKLIYSLTFRKNVESCLLPEHENLLKKAFKKTIISLKKYTQMNFCDSLILELFEDEWLSYGTFKFNEKFICPSHLLLPLLNELESNISLDNRRPNGEIEEARIQVRLFFLYRQLYYRLCKIDVTADFQIDVYPLNYMKTPCLWQDGEVQSMNERTCARCVAKDNKKDRVLYFTEDEDKFILVEPDPVQMDFAKIIIITSLRNVEAMTDRADPRSLVLSIKQKHDNTQLILAFEDPQRCLWVKRRIEDHRRSSKIEDMGLLEILLNTIDEGLSR